MGSIETREIITDITPDHSIESKARLQGAQTSLRINLCCREFLQHGLCQDNWFNIQSILLYFRSALYSISNPSCRKSASIVCEHMKTIFSRPKMGRRRWRTSGVREAWIDKHEYYVSSLSYTIECSTHIGMEMPGNLLTSESSYPSSMMYARM